MFVFLFVSLLGYVTVLLIFVFPSAVPGEQLILSPAAAAAAAKSLQECWSSYTTELVNATPPILPFIFFSFIFISWRLITLQYCSGFCHTLI